MQSNSYQYFLLIFSAQEKTEVQDVDGGEEAS